jgi:hypothetical protein
MRSQSGEEGGASGKVGQRPTAVLQGCWRSGAGRVDPDSRAVSGRLVRPPAGEGLWLSGVELCGCRYDLGIFLFGQIGGSIENFALFFSLVPLTSTQRWGQLPQLNGQLTEVTQKWQKQNL